MKKIFLTIVAGLFITSASFAQVVGDTTTVESDSLRNESQEADDQDDASGQVSPQQDTVENDAFRAPESQERAREEAPGNDQNNQSGQDMQQQSDTVNQDTDADRDAQSLQQQNDAATDSARSGVEQSDMRTDTTSTSANDHMTDTTSTSMSNQSSDAGNQGATGNTGTQQMNTTSTTRAIGANDSTAMGNNERMSYGPEVEVLTSKEGPNNEVVYRVNGQLYYVDRDEKTMVPIQESELKDANHEAVIRVGGENSEKKRSSNKG